ncbi:hypothetical protein [Corynebacterium amycolatum]|uniref:ABC transporter ATP-binding protein n=1 Tax=Corynebacterium amycolatum TaxID=43765 RepID=UPI003B5C649B
MSATSASTSSSSVTSQRAQLGDVETGGTDELFENPTEPYTRRLIDSIPGGSIELHAG